MSNRKVSLFSLRWFVVFLCSSGAGMAATAQQSPVNQLLQQLNGTCYFSTKQYNGTTLIKEQRFTASTLNTPDGSWQLAVTTTPVSGHPEAVDVSAGFRLSSGTANHTAVNVSFDFSHWSPNNYVMVPAAVYNGNRYRVIGNGYSPDYPDDMYYQPQVPLTISNNPRLQIEKGAASLIELQTTSAATPAMCFFSPQEKKGFIVLTTQATPYGNNGLTIEENAQKDSCAFRISAPAVRNLAAGFGDWHPSGDIAPNWKAGDEVTLHFRVYTFDASSIPALLTRFRQVRKDLNEESPLRNQVPMSKLLELGRGICSNNFVTVPAGSYYKPENNNDFQLGWVSGMMNTYPMLAMNNETERKRVMAELDFVVHQLQGKSGYFYGGMTASGEIRPEKMNPHFPELQAMVRKNADALLWLMKHLLLFKAQGYSASINKDWEAAAQKLAAAFTNSWKQHHEFGQYIAPATGEIAVYNSTAGAIAPAGLAMAARYFNRPEWLQTAKEAADFYYERDVVKQGLTGGDCGDISQDANSESAFGFLESLMALYYHTNDTKWLQKAEVQAALCATWTISYPVTFPANSTIGKLQCNMTGAVWASIQNKHAAPGICTASGDYLFKLFRATGKEAYAALLRDIQHAHTEAVNMPGHITSNYLPGSCMERIQPSDAEGRGSIGNFIYTRNSWTETNGMLMAMEIPGIYLQTDNGRLFVFDHLTAKIKTRKNGITTLEITNPTAYDASVSVMAESSRQAATPLAYTAFLKWPTIAVKAGETMQVQVLANGQLSRL